MNPHMLLLIEILHGLIHTMLITIIPTVFVDEVMQDFHDEQHLV